MIETKTQKVIMLVESGEWQKALSILRTFRLGFTRDEKRLIQIASDTMNGHGNFYDDLGVNTSEVVRNCKQKILEKYHIR